MAISQYLVLALGCRDTLTSEERAVLSELPVERVSYRAGDIIIEQGPAPERSCLLISGMASRQHRIGRHEKITSALHVPGDFVDLHAFLLREIDHDVVAHGDCAVEFVAREPLAEISRTQPHLMRLLWLCTLIDAKMHRVWVATRTRLRAADRIGHLFCELNARLEIVGLSKNAQFEFSLDQRTLADLLGYSSVHLNRAVQDLRSVNHLEWKQGWVHLPDPDALADAVGFDPAYLELSTVPR